MSHDVYAQIEVTKVSHWHSDNAEDDGRVAADGYTARDSVMALVQESDASHEVKSAIATALDAGGRVTMELRPGVVATRRIVFGEGMEER